MWRLIPVLLIVSACRTAPAPLTLEQVRAMDSVTLCQSAGRAFALNDADGFHMVMTEVGQRTEGPSPAECAALAQIGANSVAANAAKRQAMGDAFRNGMGEMQKALQPKPAATCTTISNTTTCRSY